ncbi:MAG: hypothetical protein HY548_04875, partial [Elusimicrobia bacterium]|nr:hypothetical protein [Elusimicrobiota bacterium]
MKPLKMILLTGGLMAGASFVSARTYLGVREWGDPIAGYGARSAAMGSTGMSRAQGAAGFRVNPAVMADLNRKEISFSFGYAVLTEKKAESPVSTRIQETGSPEFNEISFVLPFQGGKVWLGGGAAPNHDFQYEGVYAISLADGTPVLLNELDGSNALWAASLAFGGLLRRDMSWGILYERWIGHESFRASQWTSGSGQILNAWETADDRGGVFRTGFCWRPSEGFRAGAVFQPPAAISRRYRFHDSLNQSRSLSGQDRYQMPWSWGAGFSLRVPAGKEGTELALEIRQTDWSSEKPVQKPLFYSISENASVLF